MVKKILYIAMVCIWTVCLIVGTLDIMEHIKEEQTKRTEMLQEIMK